MSVNATAFSRDLELRRLLPGDSEDQRSLREQLSALIDEELRIAAETPRGPGDQHDHSPAFPEPPAPNRAEPELPYSKEDLKLVIETAPVSLLYLDREFRVTLANSFFLRRMAKPASEVIGRNIREIMGDENFARIAPHLERALGGADVKFEVRVHHPHLGEQDLQVQYGPDIRADGVVRGLVAAIEDITDRKRAEVAVRDDEERFRRALEIETVGVIFFTTDGRITEANDAFLRMSGYTRSELRQGMLRWDVMTPQEWMPHSLKAIAEFEARGRTEPYEKEYLRKDGTRWWALFAATRVRANEGVEFIIDTTQSRNAREELRRAREELEFRVQERTSELDAVNGALRDEIIEKRRSESSRQDLLRQVVTAQEEERRRISRELHDEVGQHLTALMLGLKSLESAPDGRDRTGSLKDLRALAERLGQEVHEIALRLRPTALDDLGLLRTLTHYVEEWSTRCGVEVDFHSGGLTGERLPPHIESTIYRIVQEALTNVIRHAEATRVSLLIERRANHVTVIIEDNGRGFGAETVPGDIRPKRLGLLGMSERAALVDGNLSIESNPGEGTTVFVRIPLPPPTHL
jgi:PAS domain S-box-containing protein